VQTRYKEMQGLGRMGVLRLVGGQWSKGGLELGCMYGRVGAGFFGRVLRLAKEWDTCVGGTEKREDAGLGVGLLRFVVGPVVYRGDGSGGAGEPGCGGVSGGVGCWGLGTGGALGCCGVGHRRWERG
jgi:hypothetical protein